MMGAGRMSAISVPAFAMAIEGATTSMDPTELIKQGGLFAVIVVLIFWMREKDKSAEAHVRALEAHNIELTALVRSATAAQQRSSDSADAMTAAAQQHAASASALSAALDKQSTMLFEWRSIIAGRRGTDPKPVG